MVPGGEGGWRLKQVRSMARRARGADQTCGGDPYVVCANTCSYHGAPAGWETSQTGFTKKESELLLKK